MAVAYNGSATPAFDLDAGTSQTLSYNLPADSDMVVVIVGYYAIGGGTTPASVTWNGVACTLAGSFIQGDGGGVFSGLGMYYLAAPATGTRNAVWTVADAGAALCMDVVALKGAKQASPVDVFNSDNAVDADAKSVATTTTVANTIRVGARLLVDGGGINAFAPGTGVTEVADFNDGSNGSATVGYHTDASAGAFTLTTTADTFSSPLTDIEIVAAFASEPAGGQPYIKRVGGVPFMGGQSRGAVKSWAPTMRAA